MHVLDVLRHFGSLEFLGSGLESKYDSYTTISQDNRCSTSLLVNNRNVNGVEEEGGPLNQRATQSL